MPRLRDPRWFLIAAFLLVLAAVPAIQVIVELRDQESIRAFELFNQSPTAENLRAYEKLLENANWAGRLTRPWIQHFQFVFGHGGEKATFGTEGWFFYKPGLTYMLSRPTTSKPGSTTNDPVSAIIDFREQLAARGIHLLMVPVPNKESVYPDHLSSRAPAGIVLAPRTKALLEGLRAAHVEVIDLFNAFGHARKQTNSSLYLAQDTHWSPTGVNVAAKLVAQRLTDLGWVDAGRVNYKEVPAPVKRLGDILRMLQVPVLERSLVPENVNTLQVVRSDNGQLYNDAGEAQVLVIGDSFTRIYQQDEPKGAGFVAHLARELKQPLLSLVNDGGGATLVREELANRAAFLKGKKVLIWEFVERDIGLAISGWKYVKLPSPTGPPVREQVTDKQ